MDVIRGKVLAQRFFDIADEINLPHAEALVSQLSRRPRFVGSARHIQLPNPPLEMVLGPRPIKLLGTTATDILVRVYDVGALVVTFIVDLPNPTPTAQLIALAQRAESEEAAITEAARPVAEEIKTAIKKACKFVEAADVTSDVTEDYTIFYLQHTEPACTGATLGQHLDIARLLLGEPEAVAQQVRENLLDSSFSYRPDDLAVIDWNSALILDPSGAQDVPELLELTSMQMLELRTYDAIVGKALDGLYKELEEKHKDSFLRTARYQRVSRRIMRRFVEVSEITERIDNSLTILGDTFLARLHRAAVAEFGIPHWQRQLRNKLDMLRQINELLVDQITSLNSLRLELAIVFLILLEIGVAFFRVV